MGRPRLLLLPVFLVGGVATATALLAAPGVGRSATLEQRAHRGDGDLDAPVPDVGAFGGPSRALTPAELEQWLRGRALFDKNFHRSEGCGAPDMNADSCRACHQDPAIGGAGPLELNVSRMGHDGGDPANFANVAGGQGLSKLRPPFAVGREEYDPLVTDVFEQRQSPPLFGLGDVEGILEATILANEDPDDSNGDGIRGVARMVDTGVGTELGRFGWKAQIPTIEDFARDAFGSECGLTTADPESRSFAMLADADPVADPEVDESALQDLVFFLRHLARPPPGGSTSPLRAQGEALFETVGCAGCHVPSMPGADGQPVPLFSNLLLHHVMPAGYRGMGEPGAPPGFFRTPPLWGIRKTPPYMHDGRAETIEAAILAHFGEAEAVRQAFEALTRAEKDALLHFLGDI